MSLFFLLRSIHSWRLVTMPILLTTKAFEPRSAILSLKYLLNPSINETTTMTVATPKMIPRRVRNERSLWAKIALKASVTDSRNLIKRFRIQLVAERDPKLLNVRGFDKFADFSSHT